jgi:hypothetical protein
VGEVFLDLYDLSEGATRYEWLLKEEAQSKGSILSWNPLLAVKKWNLLQ